MRVQDDDDVFPGRFAVKEGTAREHSLRNNLSGGSKSAKGNTRRSPQKGKHRVHSSVLFFFPLPPRFAGYAYATTHEGSQTWKRNRVRERILYSLYRSTRRALRCRKWTNCSNRDFRFDASPFRIHVSLLLSLLLSLDLLPSRWIRLAPSVKRDTRYTERSNSWAVGVVCTYRSDDVVVCPTYPNAPRWLSSTLPNR